MLKKNFTPYLEKGRTAPSRESAGLENFRQEKTESAGGREGKLHPSKTKKERFASKQKGRICGVKLCRHKKRDRHMGRNRPLAIAIVNQGEENRFHLGLFKRKL